MELFALFTVSFTVVEPECCVVLVNVVSNVIEKSGIVPSEATGAIVSVVPDNVVA